MFWFFKICHRFGNQQKNFTHCASDPKQAYGQDLVARLLFDCKQPKGIYNSGEINCFSLCLTYSRQRYVLGDIAMQKMAKSHVFLSGMGGLGLEIGK